MLIYLNKKKWFVKFDFKYDQKTQNCTGITIFATKRAIDRSFKILVRFDTGLVHTRWIGKATPGPTYSTRLGLGDRRCQLITMWFVFNFLLEF